jgi:dTDP-4-dehydrorhamnose reductase
LPHAKIILSLKDNLTKKIVIVTGAGGQLGQELQRASADYPQFEFIFLRKEDLAVDDRISVGNYFSKVGPVFCVNCAAYTAVDKAESEKQKAFLVNGEAVGVIAAACKQSATRLIHISTDYVFDGNSSVPLTEEDPVGPINIYGESKLAGEKLAFQKNEQTIVIRTSWVYSEYGNNFVKVMMRLMKEKESLNVIDDQIGSPTYAADLALAILQICGAENFIPGIYHYSNEGEISWYAFATAIKNLTGSSCRVNPIPSSGYPTAARRPHFSLLDKTKIKETFRLEIRNWEESLSVCIGRILKRD